MSGAGFSGAPAKHVEEDPLDCWFMGFRPTPFDQFAPPEMLDLLVK